MSPNFAAGRQAVLIRMSDLGRRPSRDRDRNRGQGGAAAGNPLNRKGKIRGQHQEWCNFWRKFGDKFGDTVSRKGPIRRPMAWGPRQISDSRFQGRNGSSVGTNQGSRHKIMMWPFPFPGWAPSSPRYRGGSAPVAARSSRVERMMPVSSTKKFRM